MRIEKNEMNEKNESGDDEDEIKDHKLLTSFIGRQTIGDQQISSSSLEQKRILMVIMMSIRNLLQKSKFSSHLSIILAGADLPFIPKWFCQEYEWSHESIAPQTIEIIRGF